MCGMYSVMSNIGHLLSFDWEEKCHGCTCVTGIEQKCEGVRDRSNGLLCVQIEKVPSGSQDGLYRTCTGM